MAFDKSGVINKKIEIKKEKHDIHCQFIFRYILGGKKLASAGDQGTSEGGGGHKDGMKNE